MSANKKLEFEFWSNSLRSPGHEYHWESYHSISSATSFALNNRMNKDNYPWIATSLDEENYSEIKTVYSYGEVCSQMKGWWNSQRHHDIDCG